MATINASIAHSPARPVPGAAPPPAGARFAAAVAKAVHRFRAYPADSPLCAEALDACHRAIQSLDEEQVVLRVAPRALYADDLLVADIASVSDFRRRLHAIGIAAVHVQRETSSRDIGCFCRELVARDGLANDTAMSDSLAARGVELVRLTMVVRPAVLRAEATAADDLARVELDERQRALSPRSKAGAHLFPPDKGWIRFDPGVPPPDHLTLTGLAQLAPDPLTLAGMLVSLADQPPFGEPADALSDQFAVVSALYRSVEPALSKTLFARLAGTVRDLPATRRNRLLRETVLPALVEGRVDGSMLRHLTDDELAESLATFDDEVAGRELMLLALDRLDLPSERREQIESLLERQAKNTEAARGEGGRRRMATSGHDPGFITVDPTGPKEFHDFAAFDLAIDRDTEAELTSARAAIAATRPSIERLRCLMHLLLLEANPDAANRLLRAVAPLLVELRTDADQRLLATWIHQLRQAASDVRAERPDIGGLIDGVLAQQLDERLLGDLLGLGGSEAERSRGPVELLEAFGAAAAPALVDLLENESVRSRRHSIVKIMSACAPQLAPGLLAYFPHRQNFVTRNLATVLGHAGPGYEPTLARVVSHPDVRVGREALRALAQIGSPAALHVVLQALRERRDVALVAEDVFWSFAGAREAALTLLMDRSFVSDHAALARRLLERAASKSREGLEQVAAELAGFRFHFWRPSHFALGHAASRITTR